MITSSDNGLSPIHNHAISWTNVDLLSNGNKFLWNLDEKKKKFAFRKLIWICFLQTSSHFVLASMWQLGHLLRALLWSNMHSDSGPWIWKSSEYCRIWLTHCGLVMTYGNMDLRQRWLRWWLAAWWHYLNQCWLIIKGVQWQSPGSTCKMSSYEVNS